MLKNFNLTIIAVLILGGCTNTSVENKDVEYGKILNQAPIWQEHKINELKTVFLDSSIDKKAPFIRMKSVIEADGGSVVEYIYRLDCANQRVAEYYSKSTHKPLIEKTKEDYGYFEYSSNTNSENYLYNPTQPNSLNKLWRTFHVDDNIFSNHCALKSTHKKPQNPEMPDWTYLQDFSKHNFGPTYVKSDQLKKLKSTGNGEVTIKSFMMHGYDSNSSSENVIKIDCKKNKVNLLQLTIRDSDFEYAPAADQSIYRSKRVFTTDYELKRNVASGKKDEAKSELIKAICS